MRGNACATENPAMTFETFTRDEPRPGRLRLADYLGGWAAVAFFPPGLAEHPELRRFEELRDDFADEDCLVLGVSIDSWFDLHETPVAFTIVADTEGTLARTFGAIVDGDLRSGTVLVDPDGVVVWDDLGDGVSADRALAGLRCVRDELERDAA
jgi:alkyl hydroperoxide reductase subunit AhpC